ncbi:MAG: 2Fe-2S iron-sulfur cluster-binding protein [Chloroflexota bacterium]
MTARRIADADGAASRETVRFSFDGRTVEGRAGEPLAVSLLAAGVSILSRSFRFHRPRGLMCSTGQCGWCECEVDGRPGVRSCQVPVRDGLVARGEHAFPSVGRDLFGWLDLGSRWIAPTFYHHRFLRPRRLRRAYLDVLRAFGGRGRLPMGGVVARGTASARVGRVERSAEPDVLVVGGGRAGLRAAIEAAERGARVTIVDAAPMVRPDGEIPALRDAAVAAGVELLDGTTAVGWYNGVVTAVSGDTLWTFRPRAVVAATGSYEVVPPVRGADRPGVMGARTVVALVERYGIIPGERALLVGEEGDLAGVRAALESAGSNIVAAVPTADLRRVHGRRGVRAASFVVDGRERRESVDLVVVGDRTTNPDLPSVAGATMAWRDGILHPVTGESGRSSVPTLSVVGSAAGRPHQPPHQHPRPHGRTLVCFCEDVHADEIRHEVAAGYADPELVKRRTGALTGPCQGKYCLTAVTCELRAAGAGVVPLPADAPPTTSRPPLTPVRLGDLVASDLAAREESSGG